MTPKARGSSHWSGRKSISSATGVPAWLRCLGGKERRAATRFLAQARTADQQGAAIGNRGRQHIINVQVDIGSVFTVVRQWETVWRFNAQDDGAGAIPWFTRDECWFPLLHAAENAG